MRSGPLLLAPAALLLAAMLLVPLAMAVAISLHLPLANLSAYAELVAGAFRTVLADTVRDSALVAAICLLLGLPAAYVYARLPARFLPMIMLLVLVPYFTSTLIRSYAWIAILGNQGLINRALLAAGLIHAPLKLAYTWFSMIVAMAQVQLPLFIIPVLAVMQRVDPRLVRAAKTLGADALTAFFTVYLPLIAPGVIAAVVMVFMTTLGFYVTPALLGPQSTLFLSQSIEMRVNTLADQPGAAAQSIVLLAMTVVLAVVFFRQLRGAFVPAEQQGAASARAPSRHVRGSEVLEAAVRLLAPLRWPVAGAIAGFATLLLVGPLMVLFPLSFSDARYLSFPPASYSWRWYAAYFTDADWQAATWLSLRLGVGGALVAVTAGGLAAFGATGLRSSSLRTGTLLAGAVPMIVSPMVLGASVFYIAARLHLVGSSLVLIACYAVLALPYPMLVTTAALSRFDWLLPKAAATLGAQPATAFRTIVLPLLAPAIASGFVFSFFLGFDDVNVALFLADPYARPLPIVMLDEIRDEISPRASAVAALFFLAAVLLCLAQLAAKAGTRAWARRRSLTLAEAGR